MIIYSGAGGGGLTGTRGMCSEGAVRRESLCWYFCDVDYFRMYDRKALTDFYCSVDSTRQLNLMV